MSFSWLNPLMQLFFIYRFFFLVYCWLFVRSESGIIMSTAYLTKCLRTVCSEALLKGELHKHLWNIYIGMHKIYLPAYAYIFSPVMFHPSSLCTSVAYDVQIKRAVEETIVYILNVQRYNKHRDKANVTVTFQVYRDLANTETKQMLQWLSTLTWSPWCVCLCVCVSTRVFVSVCSFKYFLFVFNMPCNDDQFYCHWHCSFFVSSFDRVLFLHSGIWSLAWGCWTVWTKTEVPLTGKVQPPLGGGK